MNTFPSKDEVDLFGKFKWLLFLCATSCLMAPRHASAQTVQERLGYPATARLLVVHADDFGMNHSVNRAIAEALENGWVTSASVMVPCPWFPEVARFAVAQSTTDLGIHLTLTSEWHNLRWGPVDSRDKVPSLIDAAGYFPPDPGEIVSDAQPAEVESELHAQIDRALKMGMRPSHLDSHMGTLFHTIPLFRLFVKMGHAYGLPVLSEEDGNDPVLQPAGEVLIKKIIAIEPGVPAQDWIGWYEKTQEEQGPGVYQLIVHLAYDDEEMRATALDHPDFGAAWRQRDFDMVRSPEFHKFLKDQGYILVNWKDLARALPKDYGKNAGK